jgi:diketogulonate reductase-like aldo/keto reductase
MPDTSLTIDGVRVPRFLYGTAWKEDETQRLTELALRNGFRGIDTANQRKHYFEEAVGRGIARANIPRDELFVQTKFTFREGQDQRLPYDEHAAVAVQVAQSVASSLQHLGVTRLDSLVLHGPSQHAGLGPRDHEAWRAMEALVTGKRVVALGISNATAAQVAELVDFAQVAPAYVQNRCYANRGWDRETRAVCRANAIVYQGFSLLTANRDVVHHETLRALVKRHAHTASQIVFRFCQQVGMLPLTGTSSLAHMTADLSISDFTLAPDELAAIERVGLA